MKSLSTGGQMRIGIIMLQETSANILCLEEADYKHSQKYNRDLFASYLQCDQIWQNFTT